MPPNCRQVGIHITECRADTVGLFNLFALSNFTTVKRLKATAFKIAVAPTNVFDRIKNLLIIFVEQLSLGNIWTQERR
jgi:hypothetical protein